MATTSLQNFLSGLTSAATGYLQGTQAGEQQRRADDLQSFQMLHQLGAEQQQQQDQQRSFLASQVPHLASEAQPQAVQELANFKPATNPYGISAYQDLRAGKGLPSFTAGTGTASPSPVTPPPSPAPIPFGKAGAPGVSPALHAAGSAPPVAPGTPPATATGTPSAQPNPRTVNFPLGGKQVSLEYGGGVDAKRLARLNTAYQGVAKALREVPANSPVLASIQNEIGNVNLNPQTEEEATTAERAVQHANFLLGGQGLGARRLAAGILAKGPQELTRYATTLAQSDPRDMIAGLGQLASEARSLQATAQAAGGRIQLPPAIADSLDEIDQIMEQSASGDPEQAARAQGQAEDLVGRIRIGKSPAQQTASLNAFLKLISKRSPADPNYEAEVAADAKTAGVDQYMKPGPDGKYHLGGAMLDRGWSSWLNKLLAAKGVDKKTQRVILNEGRGLAVLRGVDPNTIPDEVTAQMSPLQQAQLTKTQNENDVFYTNEERKAAQAQREQQLFDANYARLKAKPAGNGINAAQTLENLYKTWQTKQKQYDAELKAGGLLTDNDIAGKAGSILSVADQKTFQAKRAAVGQLEHNYKAYFNQVQYVPGQAGAGADGTRAAGAGTTAPGTPPKRSRSEMAAFLRQRNPSADPKAMTHWLNTHGY